MIFGGAGQPRCGGCTGQRIFGVFTSAGTRWSAAAAVFTLPPGRAVRGARRSDERGEPRETSPRELARAGVFGAVGELF